MEHIKFEKDDSSPTTDRVASQPLNDLLCGDLVVVSHWSDYDWPHDAVELGILREVRDGYYYINDSKRGYKHCKFVHRKNT